MIKIENISAGYQKEIVNSVNIELEAGCLAAICGPNGCGKTTLLKAIMNTGVKVSGRCMCNGTDILKLPPKKRARKVSLLPQILETADGIAVKDVLEMAFYKDIKWPGRLTGHMRRTIYEVSEITRISALLNKEYCRLSQGQKQLVLWTRLILQDTELVLLDEPDSALDFINRHAMLNKIRKLINNSAKTGLVVLHDPGYALNYCDKIFLMNNGRIKECIDTHSDTIDSINTKMQKIYPGVKIEKPGALYTIWPEKENIDAND